jgi:hypothetical protein
MLVALALYTSTAHAGIPPDSAERRASVRMQTNLTEDQRVLPKYSQRLPEAIRGSTLPVQVKPDPHLLRPSCTAPRGRV